MLTDEKKYYDMEFKETKTKWDNLSKEDRLELIELSDRLGIPPNLVGEMYEQGHLSLGKEADNE